MRKLSAIVLIMFILCGCFSRVSSKPVSYDSLDAALEFYDLDLDVELDNTLSNEIKNVTYTVERNLKGQSVECLEFVHDDSLYHLYFSVSLDVNDILNLAHTTEYDTFDSFVAGDYRYMIMPCDKHACVLQGEDNASALRFFDSIHRDSDIVVQHTSNYDEAVSLFIPISYDNAKEIYRESSFTGILYIGRESCNYCKALVNVLYDASLDAGYTVLYLDSEKAKESESFEGFDFIVDQDGNPLSMVPSLMVFADGAVVDSHTGIVDGYKPEEALSDEQYIELYDLLVSYDSLMRSGK